MKKILPLLLFVLAPIILIAQYPKGSVVVDYIRAPSLRVGSEEIPDRRVTIYLPPNYTENRSVRYPVIYYLHGFTWSDSLQIASDQFDKLLDKAIATGKIEPVIVAMPNHHTEYRGSFYTNSTLTGNWADFTAYDLVEHVDQNYRTIPNRLSRGIAGHSMGGHGAIKLGMLYPDVFSTVYALSPAVMGLAEEWSPSGDAFRRAQQIQSKEELTTGYKEFYANAVIAVGRAFSPNPDNPPFQTDLPFTYEGDSLVVHEDVLDLWNKNLPLEMVSQYAGNLRKLTALKLDWGRNDEGLHIPVTCRMFSVKLEGLGIEHYAEEYIGTHSNKLWTNDGRALNDMLPFFQRYLVFE